MDDTKGKVISLHDSLQALNLQSSEESVGKDKVLVGKILTPKSFQRFTVTEMISKTWNLGSRVHIEKLGDNLFKFSLGSKEDKEFVFRSRPWSLNGAHMILKEWPREMVLSEISFAKTTFHIQVHGLPPVYLHEGTTRMLGNKIGEIHQDSINRRSVVAQSYLRFRVEIEADSPLPAGFFVERLSGNDIWIQFKLERLSDFCYKCGMLSHVTGRCNFGEPALLLTSPNGITAKVFGPWLRADNRDTILFINLQERGHHRSLIGEGTALPLELALISRSGQQGAKGSQMVEQSNLEQVNPNLEVLNAMGRCTELEVLKLSLERQDLGNMVMFQTLVLNKLKDPLIGPEGIANWARKLIQELAMSKNARRRELESLDPDYLAYVGLGRSPLIGPTKSRSRPIEGLSQPRKKAASTNMEGSARKLQLVEIDIEEIHQLNVTTVEDLSKDFEEAVSSNSRRQNPASESASEPVTS